MRTILFILVFALLGGIVGFLLYGNIGGVDLSFQTIFFGADTGNDLLNTVADTALAKAQRRILIAVLAGAGLGLLLDLIFRFRKKA